MWNRKAPILARLIPCVTGCLLAACGGTTNLNKIFGGTDSSADGKLNAALIAYDRGNFTQAEQLASSLVAENGLNERASILLGYIHLSQAGVDPFVLARKLIDISKSGSSSSSPLTALLEKLDISATTADAREELAATEAPLVAAPNTNTATNTSTSTSGSTSSGLSSVLVKLQDIISLSTSEKTALFLREFATTDVSTAPSQLVLFGSDNELMLPKEVDAALRSGIEVLSKLDSAIADICAFVDSDIITTEAQRETSTKCTATSYSRKYATQAHFVWALSHLAEAVTLQRAILYVPEGSSKTSIDNANAKVSALGSTDLNTLINAMAEIVAAMDKVFDASNAKSMTQTTLTDLQMVSLGFAKIANMPASIQSSINSAFTDITNVSKQAAGGISAANNAKAFKTQVTTTLTKSLSSKIQSAATGGKATTEQISKMCASYTLLTADATSTSSVAQAKPAACTST
ncbi:MAG: hypothetical protein FJ146_00410 [Deltaproteobacteria bacterium]|nr:hypothetical protein [Deltaproteobacteria bacterium]